MPEKVLIKWLLFLLMIAPTGGWEFSRVSPDGQEIMKTILESCYGKNNSLNPVIIFGDFNKFIDGLLTIRINDFVNAENYARYESLKLKASSVVLMEEPPQKLISNVYLLGRTILWNNMIPFFIVGRSEAPCIYSVEILRIMWQMEILNSIYICTNSINKIPEIYTLNPITNYAPHPWTRVAELPAFNLFRQKFDANISCTQLTYDKTKILDGYNIVAVDWTRAGLGLLPGVNYFDTLAESPYVNHRVFRTIILALNASCKYEYEMGYLPLESRYYAGLADIIVPLYTLYSFPGHPYLFPLWVNEMVAVVKLGEEVSTLEKICHMWSIPVLIAAGFVLAVLFLVLMIKEWSFGSALLDLTRLLTYVSIQADNRYHSFRIYFTTMLIFMVISNGVFQSKIAAFLTTRERSSAVESIHELAKLGYQMHTVEVAVKYAEKGCPECEFKGVFSHDVCLELVLNSTKNVCAIDKSFYEAQYILFPVDRAREAFNSEFAYFTCRPNWPLRDRFNTMIMRVVESGLPNFWEMKRTSIPKAKRQSLEAERASAQYRPVVLAKLDFAFELLAVGLSVATIVFLLELCWTRYEIRRNCRRKCTKILKKSTN